MRGSLTCSGGWGFAPGTPWAAPCITHWLLGVRTSPVGWMGAVCRGSLGCPLQAVPYLAPSQGCPGLLLPSDRAGAFRHPSMHSSCYFDPNQGGLCRGQASPHHLSSQLSAVAPCGRHVGPQGPVLPEARAAAALLLLTLFSLCMAVPPSHVCSWPRAALPCTSWSGQRHPLVTIS